MSLSIEASISTSALIDMDPHGAQKTIINVREVRPAAPLEDLPNRFSLQRPLDAIDNSIFLAALGPACDFLNDIDVSDILLVDVLVGRSDQGDEADRLDQSHPVGWSSHKSRRLGVLPVFSAIPILEGQGTQLHIETYIEFEAPKCLSDNKVGSIGSSLVVLATL